MDVESNTCPARRHGKKYVYYTILFLILVGITISLKIRISPNPPQSIMAYDMIDNIYEAKYFILHHRISQISYHYWKGSWIYNPKPLGFPILIGEFSLLSNISVFGAGYFSLLYYSAELLIVFMLTFKLSRNIISSMFASFLMLTYLAGQSSHGPIMSTYGNIDVILFFSAMLTIIFINNPNKKILLSSLFMSGIIITHRPGLIFIFIFGVFLLIFSIFLNLAKRTKIWNTITFPYILSFIIGWDISVIYWHALKIENILLFGFPVIQLKLGAFPDFFNHLINTISYIEYIFILSSANLILILYYLWIIRKKSSKNYEILNNINSKKISTVLFFLSSLAIPVSIGAMILFIGITSGIPFNGDPLQYFMNIWAIISIYAHLSLEAKLLKQILYIWHWNIIALLFLIPSSLVILRNFKTNILSSMFLVSIFSIVFTSWFSQAYFGYETVIQRLYLYLAPMVYSIIATVFVSYIGSVEKKRSNYSRYNILKGGIDLIKIVTITLILLNFSTYVYFSGSVTQQQYTDKYIELFYYSKQRISVNKTITAEEHDVVKGTLLDNPKYRIVYPYWGRLPPDEFLEYVYKRNIDYIFCNIDPRFVPLTSNKDYLNFNSLAWKIYSTDYRSIYYVEYR